MPTFIYVLVKREQTSVDNRREPASGSLSVRRWATCEHATF